MAHRLTMCCNCIRETIRYCGKVLYKLLVTDISLTNWKFELSMPVGAVGIPKTHPIACKDFGRFAVSERC